MSAGKDVGQKAKDVSEIAKLKMDIRSKEDFVENSMRNLEKHIMRNTKMRKCGNRRKDTGTGALFPDYGGTRRDRAYACRSI